MWTVFFGLLCHQTNILYGSHGCRIESAVFLAVVNGCLENTGIGSVRNHCEGISSLSIRSPHFSWITDHCRHGSVDDHVTWNMQVGNTFIGINHCQRRSFFVASLDICFNFSFLVCGQGFNSFVKIAKAHVRIHTDFFERVGMFVKNLLEENINNVTKKDRIGNFHHCRFKMGWQQNTPIFSFLNRFSNICTQGFFAHNTSINNFSSFQCKFFFKNSCWSVCTNQFDINVTCFFNSSCNFSSVIVAFGHWSNVGFGVRRPGTHGVGIFLGKLFNRNSCSTIGVSFP